MHEGDPTARRPGTWYLVYQTISGSPAGLECGIEVGDLITDVVNTGAPLGQELSNWTVGVERGEQLHFRVSEWKRQDSGAIDPFGWMRHDPQDVPVEGECRFQVGDGNSDMRNAGEIGHWFLEVSGAAGPRGGNSGVLTVPLPGCPAENHIKENNQHGRYEYLDRARE